MISFQYKAINSAGIIISGESDSTDEQALLTSLRGKGLRPLQINQKNRLFPYATNRNKPLSDHHTYQTISNLAGLLSGGVSLEKALEVLISGQKTRSGANRFLQLVLAQVRGGSSLSKSLTDSRMISVKSLPIVVALVSAGEQSGTLAESMQQAADLLQGKLETTKKIQAALSYPAIILFVALFTVIFMGSVIAPAFQSLFQDFGKEVPPFLQLLMTFSDVAPGLLLVALSTGMVLRAYKPWANALRMKAATLVLSLPILSNFIVQRDIASFSFILSSLLKGGVELMTALNLSTNGIENTVIAAKITTHIQDVSRGQAFAESFAAIEFMPQIFGQLSQVGQANGTLPEMLHQISLNLRNDLQDRLDKIIKLLPVAMIFLLGGLIAGLVTAVFGAILEINDLVL